MLAIFQVAGQHERTRYVAVTVTLLLVHHAGTLRCIGGAGITVINLDRHHSVLGEPAEVKRDHTAGFYRGAHGGAGSGGVAAGAAGGQCICGTYAQPQAEGGSSAYGSGLTKRCRETHGSPLVTILNLGGAPVALWQRGGAPETVCYRPPMNGQEI